VNEEEFSSLVRRRGGVAVCGRAQQPVKILSARLSAPARIPHFIDALRTASWNLGYVEMKKHKDRVR